MRIRSLLLLAGGALLCGVASFSVTALAEGGPGGMKISAEKMEAIRACAAAKGVELPAPPPKGEKPPEGTKPPEGGEAAGGQPPKDGKGGPPKLTEAQRAILDACFEANGVTPPKGPPQGGHKGGAKAGGSTPSTDAAE